MEELWRLHPIVVHFPIALLTVGLAAAWWGHVRKLDRLADAATWLLWLGAASVCAAAGLGLLAEKTAHHVPPAWETLADHKTWGLWTAGLFVLLSLWRWTKRAPLFMLLAWLFAWAILVRVADLGGDLVYTYGMGVDALNQ